MKPSVTELLGLLDKPGLIKWANKIGLEGVSLKQYREKALAKGTSLHNQIGAFLKDGVEIEDKYMAKQCDNFLNNVEVLGSEVDIETDYFVGRYDIKFKKNGVTYLGDFKSSKGVYLDNILQLVSYRMAEPVDKLAIIEIPSMITRNIAINDYSPYEDIVKALALIYDRKEIINASDNR